MKCIYLDMYESKVGMIGLGNWGKNIYRNLEKLNVLEKIYENLESGMPENKSIKAYALPNARQWLGGRFVAIWVFPIYFL